MHLNGNRRTLRFIMANKPDTHSSHSQKPAEKAAEPKTEEKFIDSLGQENPAMELEKKLIADKAKAAEEAAAKEENK